VQGRIHYSRDSVDTITRHLLQEILKTEPNLRMTIENV